MSYRGFEMYMAPGETGFLGVAHCGTVVLASLKMSSTPEQIQILRSLVDAWHDERQWIEQRAAEISARWNIGPVGTILTNDEREGYEIAMWGVESFADMRWTREHEAGYLARIIWETI